MNRALERHDLGEFRVKSGEVIVSDPCYEEDTWCAGRVKVAPGIWRAHVEKPDSGSWGNRCAELHANLIGHTGGGWDELPFEIVVDSGQAGIFDVANYRNDADEKGWTYKSNDGKPLCGEGWYDICCDTTIGDVGAGVIPGGVVSSSGYGDGDYVGYCRRVEGKIVGLKIVFIPEEETEEEDY